MSKLIAAKSTQIDMTIKSEQQYELAANVAQRLTDSLIEYKSRSLPEEGRRKLIDKSREAGIGQQFDQKP